MKEIKKEQVKYPEVGMYIIADLDNNTEIKASEIIINRDTTPEGMEAFKLYMRQRTEEKGMPDFYKDLTIEKKFTKEDIGIQAIYNKDHYSLPINQYEYEFLDILFEKTSDNETLKAVAYRLYIEKGSFSDYI